MGYIEDNRAIESYIHDSDYYNQEEEKEPVICYFCEEAIKSGNWSYEIDGNIICSNCLESYMQINHGKIED